jgi:hypothetical protein
MFLVTCEIKVTILNSPVPMTPPPYLWVYLVFLNLAIPSVILLGLSRALLRAGSSPAVVRSSVRSIGLILFAWLGLAGLLGWAGAFRSEVNRDFPFIALAILLPIGAGAVWLRSSSARQILSAIPQSWLVGLQVYRGAGAIFLLLLGLGLLPGVFALPAGFGDVTVGLVALLVAAIASRDSKFAPAWILGWNLFGIADLVVAVGTGFLSAPTRFQLLSPAAPNVLVGFFPLVLIPVYAVPLSVILHLASLTKLAREGRKVSAPGGGTAENRKFA